MSISKFLMPMISFFLFLVAGVGVAVASALRCCYSPHLIAISATPEMNRIDMMALAVNVLLRNLDIKWVMLIAFYGLWYKCWSYWIRFFFLRLYACNCENKSVLHECGKAIQLCYPIDFFFFVVQWLKEPTRIHGGKDWCHFFVLIIWIYYIQCDSSDSLRGSYLWGEWVGIWMIFAFATYTGSITALVIRFCLNN